MVVISKQADAKLASKQERAAKAVSHAAGLQALSAVDWSHILTPDQIEKIKAGEEVKITVTLGRGRPERPGVAYTIMPMGWSWDG
jgi:hypothetical protein